MSTYTTKKGGGGHQQEYNPSTGRYGHEIKTTNLPINKHFFSQQISFSELLDDLISYTKEVISKRGRNFTRSVNTASIVYDETTGKKYYGFNKGIYNSTEPKNETLFKSDDFKSIMQLHQANPLENFEPGNCAEFDAFNKALNHGAKLCNLHLVTINIYQRKFGTPKRTCQYCDKMFKGKIKKNYTGWSCKKGENK